MWFSKKKKTKPDSESDAKSQKDNEKTPKEHVACREAEENWLRPEINERYHGFAILQRRNRLVELRDKADPKTNDALEKEIQVLNVNYWHHRRRMVNLIIGMKKKYIVDAPNVDDFLYSHRHQDEKNRPWIWISRQKWCADEGGCCGRSCGCCEKPLDSYDRPVSFKDQKKKIVTFGHCTGECACCAKTRGAYSPDSKLPETKFAIGI